jgi:hypothetical protein
VRDFPNRDERGESSAMKPDEIAEAPNISRRTVLRSAALIAGGSALLAGLGVSAVLAAGTKLPPSAVGYRPIPMGKSRCDNCSQWVGPTVCKVVSGQLSPSGWCSLYSPKS